MSTFLVTTESTVNILMPKGWPQVLMPILYVREWNRYSANPSAGSTEQSPGSQPQNFSS